MNQSIPSDSDASTANVIERAILALDIGTSSCKGALYAAASGRLLAESSQSYGIQRPAELWVEQLPDDWWSAVQTVCQELVKAFPADQIVGVGVTGQVPTMVLLDKNGKALASAISWQDRRADREATWLREEIGPQKLAEWLGMALPIDAGWPPARLLWLARNRAELLEATHKIVMAKDYIVCQLTGVFCSDPWSAKGLIHLLTGEPSADYYHILGVSESVAPRIFPAHQVVGEVTSNAAALLGLKAGTPVINGSSDAVCGMIGTGAVGQEQTAFNLTGTSEMIGRSGGQPTEGLLFIPDLVTGGYPILYGPTQSGGDSLVWFTEFSRSDFESAVAAAESTPAGSGGVVFLPYLAGERAPIWDSTARGAFLGLLRQHNFGSGARSVMEGVAMSVRHVLETSGVEMHTGLPLRIAGGSARLSVWSQIRADVTGLRVEVVEQASAVTLGAAMLAAVGVGLFASLNAAGSMVRIQETILPRPENRAVYDEAYRRFRNAYIALRSVGWQ